MTRKLDIRPFTHDDLAEILAIENASFSDPWNKSKFEEELNIQYSLHYAAAIDKNICGYIIVWYAGGEFHILNIAVSPAQRRKGIAKALISFITDLAVQKGVTGTFLEVRSKNEAALRLYAESGFTKYGIRKKYYPDDDAVLMRRP